MGARRKHGSAALALTGLVLVGGCGGGERQDENEPDADFEVEVVRATFPAEQKLAKSSVLRITVRNAGDRTIPNIGATVDGFNFRKSDPTLADPTRPVFAVNGVPVVIGGLPESKDATPLGCDTAYVNTWACGPLAAGKEKTMLWEVTAVRAGPYELVWRVNAGLHGNARAVAAVGGERPGGSFRGVISDEAPESRIAEDGKTIVSGSG